MPEPVSSTNIAAAAITSQLGLVAILWLGSTLLRSGDSDERPWRAGMGTSRLAWAILPFTLLTAVPLVFSADFLGVWTPMFSDASFPAVSLSTATFIMFAGDVVLVAVLVGMTGGSKHSPFAPVYFVLPALAIFLRDPRVFWYTGSVALLFLLQLAGSWLPPRPGESYAKAEVTAYATVSLLCLVLSVFIGYVTRPR